MKRDAFLMSRRAILSGSVGLLAAGHSWNGAVAQTTTPLSVRLDWTPWGDQAGIHLAAAKGWFRDAGLDVTISDGNGSTQTVQIVGGGSDVDIGFAALSSMMVARDKGLTVKAIANYARRSDIGLMVPLDSGITAIGDLRGKRLAHTASSLETPFLDFFLAHGGLKRGDVTLVNLDGAAKLGAYLGGKVDGAFSSIPFFVPAVAVDRPSRGLLFADVGLHLPSFGLFAREDVITSKRAALTSFVSLVDAAWAYIVAGHVDEAVEAIQKARPNAKLNRTVMRGQVTDFITYFPTPDTKSLPPGRMAEADWTEAIETMEKGKMIKSGSKASDYFTNDLFDETTYRKAAAS